MNKKNDQLTMVGHPKQVEVTYRSKLEDKSVISHFNKSNTLTSRQTLRMVVLKDLRLIFFSFYISLSNTLSIFESSTNLIPNNHYMFCRICETVHPRYGQYLLPWCKRRKTKENKRQYKTNWSCHRNLKEKTSSSH